MTAIMAGACLNAQAREKKERQPFELKPFEVRLGISGYPLMPALENEYGTVPVIFSWERTYKTPSIDELYMDREGAHYTAGNIGAEFSWNAKKWLAVCAGFHVTPFWADVYDGYTHERKKRESSAGFSGLVSVRFNYVNRPHVRLYSSIGTGFYVDRLNTSFQLQGIPIGVSFGGNVFGFAEVGIGTLFMGGNIGVGYKF